MPAAQTTYIASGAPNNNFGGQSFMNLGWAQSGANAMRMLVQFDLRQLPANAQIDRARFFIGVGRWRQFGRRGRRRRRWGLVAIISQETTLRALGD